MGAVPRLQAVHSQLSTPGAAAASVHQQQARERSGAELREGLTDAQVEHYHQHGYVVLRQLYAPDEVATLREEFDTLLERSPSSRGSVIDARGEAIPSASLPDPASYFKFTDPEKGDDPRTFNSSTQVLNRVDDALAFMPAIRRSYGSTRLLASVSSLLGPDFVPFGDSYVAKPPRHGAGFAWHQDTGISVDFPYDWQEERGTNFGVYLHESTVANGCLHVVRAHTCS